MFKIEFNNHFTNNENCPKLHYLYSALKNEAKLLENPEYTFDQLFKQLGYRFEKKMNYCEYTFKVGIRIRKNYK